MPMCEASFSFSPLQCLVTGRILAPVGPMALHYDGYWMTWSIVDGHLCKGIMHLLARWKEKGENAGHVAHLAMASTTSW